MELNRSSENIGTASSEAPQNQSIIQVRAIMTCPSCEWRKTFKNQFYRRDMELMVVALKVFDWLTCPRCGDLINLNLEYLI